MDHLKAEMWEEVKVYHWQTLPLSPHFFLSVWISVSMVPVACLAGRSFFGLQAFLICVNVSEPVIAVFNPI